MKRIFQISDLHGRLEKADKLAEQIGPTDYVVLSGDVTHYGDGEKAEHIVNLFSERAERVFAVPGNCDTDSGMQKFEALGVSLHDTRTTIDGQTWTGLGGSLPCPGKTAIEYPESFFQDKLVDNWDHTLTHHVAVIHQPPLDTRSDMIRSGPHVGSAAVREHLQKFEPILLMVGHIHESPCIQEIGSTTLVNPGTAAQGHYAVIEIDQEGVNSVQLF